MNGRFRIDGESVERRQSGRTAVAGCGDRFELNLGTR
jgi:hypothetical protein